MFKFFDFEEQETSEHIQALIDFCNYVEVYDVYFNKIGEAPLFALLDELDENFIEKLQKKLYYYL